MKTKISAKVVCDSLAPHGIRLTTLELTYPRFILAEFNTHRVFSRNSASSRAIPIQKMLRAVLFDPAVPVEWGANRKGMQAGRELRGIKKWLVRRLWLLARYPACAFSYGLFLLGLHKQISNRILEPWMWTKTLVTATEWDNFFDLRLHVDAQPEIRELAEQMSGALWESAPIKLSIGQWHLPYVTEEEKATWCLESQIKMSAARSARISYLTHEGRAPDTVKDFELYEDLVGSRPIHASPTEHQATPKYTKDFSKNLRGWYQHRSDVEGRV